MILNNAQDIKRGSIQTQYVYHGSILIWPPETPPVPPTSIDPDKYENYSDAIVIVRLDKATGEETDDIYYARKVSPYTSAADNAFTYLGNQYGYDADARFNVYYGDGIAYPDEQTWKSLMATYLNRSSTPKNRNNINMFRFKKVGAPPVLSYVSGANHAGMSNLKIVIMPEEPKSGYTITIPQNFLRESGVEQVIFRSASIYRVWGLAFYKCTNLRSIELPTLEYTGGSGTNSGIYPNAFRGCGPIRIELNNATGSIAGEPWGATDASVIWKG